MPLSWQPSDADLGDLGDLDITTPADGDTLVYDDATGTWTTGVGGPDLSDDTPEALGTATSGVGAEASRDDHVHAMPTAADVGAAPEWPWTEFIMESPDGTLWTFTADNTGTLSSSELAARVTESGDVRVTESGDVRILEG